MPNKICHPERNVSRAKRATHGVEGPYTAGRKTSAARRSPGELSGENALQHQRCSGRARGPSTPQDSHFVNVVLRSG